MNAVTDERHDGPIRLAERVLDVLFKDAPSPLTQDAAINIVKAMLPYRQALQRQNPLGRPATTTAPESGGH